MQKSKQNEQTAENGNALQKHAHNLGLNFTQKKNQSIGDGIV